MALIWITRYTVVAIAACLLCNSVAAQSKFIVWPKEPGRRIQPSGVLGGQAVVLAQMDAFEIEEILVEGKPVVISQPFNASDDWLNDITIRIKNVSQQKFSLIEIMLMLPQINSGPAIPVSYGLAADQRGKVIGPGDVVELKTLRDDKFYTWVKTSISKKALLSTITTAQIYQTVAILSDGSTLLSVCVRTSNPLNACPRSGAP